MVDKPKHPATARLLIGNVPSRSFGQYLEGLATAILRAPGQATARRRGSPKIDNLYRVPGGGIRERERRLRQIANGQIKATELVDEANP